MYTIKQMDVKTTRFRRLRGYLSVKHSENVDTSSLEFGHQDTASLPNYGVTRNCLGGLGVDHFFTRSQQCLYFHKKKVPEPTPWGELILATPVSTQFRSLHLHCQALAISLVLQLARQNCWSQAVISCVVLNRFSNSMVTREMCISQLRI